MSTLAYGELTRKREEAPPDTSKSTAPPGVRSYVDALAALVPAEVLTVHAVALTFTTRTEKSQAGEAVTTITSPGTLTGVFIALLVLSVLLYAVGRGKRLRQWDLADAAGAFIPPLAFVGWTMLQKSTAFDAVAPGLPQAPRDAIALIGAVVLGLAAGWVANKEDQKTPNP